MVMHKEQRVGIFVDVQNMYYSAKQLYNSKVNFNAILKEGVAGRKLIRAMAYVIRADIHEEKHFFGALSNIGFDVRVKDLQIFFGGAKKGDWDVGLAMDVIRMAGKLDTVILVSGDGDFKDMLEFVKAAGCRAEVIAFGKTTSSRLKEEADLFIDMDKNPKKYLIGRIVQRQTTRRRVPLKPASQTKDVQQAVASASKAAPVTKTSTSTKAITAAKATTATKATKIKSIKTKASGSTSAKPVPSKKAPDIFKDPPVKIEMPKQS